MCLCKYPSMIPQMGEEYSLGPSERKEQNVVFADSQESYTTSFKPVSDPTRYQQDTYDAELANFFARPIKIAELEWAVAGSLFYQFDPWSLYLNDPKVSNRICNFNLLRTRLHLKFVINGNGFMYSRALVSYLPFANWDALSESEAIYPEDLTQESQQPHIFLNPTTSSGGDMILPFVWPWNSVYIPTSEWENLGRVTLRSFAPLKHANGATAIATISVFAWAEDMNLNVLTSVDPSTMTPQSGEEIDEANNKGTISGPASAVSKAASALTTIPAIAPFATATSMAASGVANIAKSLGYSRPPVTRDNEPIKPVATSSLALTTVPDSCHRLTLDDKQELSIDPRISGLDSDDPLSIKDIASKESFLTQFSWAISTSPGTLLWNARVDPCTFNYGGFDKFYFPACCVAAMPFHYWTGTMKFRFQVMSSAYHKGRLKITWDPNWVASEEFNTMYTRVVDLEAESDFTISVSNGQYSTLLRHHLPGVDSVNQLYSGSRLLSKEEGNGVIAVSILNELTTPNSTVNNDVSINVFVSMGDDFEVYVPDDHFSNFVYKPQSGEENPDTVNAQDKPEHDDGHTIGPTINSLDKIPLVYVGESVKSFRQMLKRYNLHSVYSPSTTGDRSILLSTAYFPFLRGNMPDAINTTALAAPYNYCNTILLHFIVNCFSGWRGSIRTKVIPQGYFKHDDRLLGMTVERDNPANSAIAQYALTNIPLPSYASSDKAAFSAVNDSTSTSRTFGVKGMTYTTSAINPTVEFEIPFYSRTRFVPGKIDNYTGIRSYTVHEIPRINYQMQLNGNSTTTLQFYNAIGEDFTTYFWTGCPPMWYEANPPIA